MNKNKKKSYQNSKHVLLGFLIFFVIIDIVSAFPLVNTTKSLRFYTKTKLCLAQMSRDLQNINKKMLPKQSKYLKIMFVGFFSWEGRKMLWYIKKHQDDKKRKRRKKSSNMTRFGMIGVI